MRSGTMVLVAIVAVALVGCDAGPETGMAEEDSSPPAAASSSSAEGTEAAADSRSAGAAEVDSRQAIELPPKARMEVIDEMHLMLEAAQGTLAEMARGDAAAAAEAARGGGTQVAVDRDPGMQEHLPADFGSLGMATHVAFDNLAGRLEQGAPQDSVLADLSGLMENCNECHSNYRLASLHDTTP